LLTLRWWDWPNDRLHKHGKSFLDVAHLMRAVPNPAESAHCLGSDR
jgi:hypothetical protein